MIFQLATKVNYNLASSRSILLIYGCENPSCNIPLHSIPQVIFARLMTQNYYNLFMSLTISV